MIETGGGAVAVNEAAKPKHRQLFDDLGLAIRRGAFVPGQRLPTEVELMQQYGVSRTTVTRTLRDLEHRGVIRRRRGSGTFVTEVQHTAIEQYGMMLHGIEPGSIFLNVYDALAAAADRSGRHVLVSHFTATANRVEAAAESAQRLISRGVRGVFYLPHNTFDEGGLINRRVVELFARAKIPIVLLDRDICNFPQRSELDLVAVDNLRGGYLLGQHLIDTGCRRPMFFSDDVEFSSARARWIGYRGAMEANKIEPRVFWGNPQSPAAVMQAVRDHTPDGIVCDNDNHAAMVMRHLLNAKIAIPQEIKLAGFDDTPTASLLAVPLTTVRQPAATIAERAVSVMNERLAHPHLPPVHLAVNCELIVRDSTVLGSGAAGSNATIE